MKNPEKMMLPASVLGALFGAVFTVYSHPIVNFDYFLVLFMMIGVAGGNLALLVLYEIIHF